LLRTGKKGGLKKGEEHECYQYLTLSLYDYRRAGVSGVLKHKNNRGGREPQLRGLPEEAKNSKTPIRADRWRKEKEGRGRLKHFLTSVMVNGGWKE